MSNNITETERLLDKLIGDSLPINLDDLASALNATIYEEKLEDEVSGMLITSESSNKSIIVVNKNHHENRRRFTAAHELAHLLLHKDKKDTFIDSVGTSTIYFRSNDSSEKLKQMEREANELASRILMPERLMIKMLSVSPVDINDDAGVKMLARQAGVSIQALSIRLSKLQLSY